MNDLQLGKSQIEEADRKQIERSLSSLKPSTSVEYCKHCLRPFASSEDWDHFSEGEGEHLCWNKDATCSNEPTFPREDIQEMIIQWFIGENTDKESQSFKIQRKAFLESAQELVSLISRRLGYD